MTPVGITALLVLLCQPPGVEPAERPDEEILKEAKLPLDPPGLAKYLQALPPNADQRKQAAALVEQLGDPAFERREAAEAALAKLLPGAVAVLRSAKQSADAEIAERARFLIAQLERDGRALQWRAAVRVLSKQPPPAFVEVLLGLLPLCYDDVTEEEVLTALVRGAGKGDKLPAAVTAALEDADPARRAASALLLGRAGSVDQRKKVQTLLADPALEVRLRAAQGLLAARDRAGLAVLVQVLRDGSQGQARQANDLLTALAGGTALGALDVGMPTQRASLARTWEAWLAGPGRQIDLARAEVEFGTLNRTIAALQIARKFVAAAEIGDQQRVKPLLGFPYVHMDSTIAATPQELENVFNNQGFQPPPRLEFLPLTRTLSLDAARAGSLGARNLATRHPRDEVVAVESTYRHPNHPNATRILVYVRLPKAGPAKVVGYSYLNFDTRRPMM